MSDRDRIQARLEDRPEDKPLNDDVRWLGRALGDAIRRFAGDATFEAVEHLRTACRARRRGEPDAPALKDLLDHVRGLDPDTAATVARAFTLYFLLINTAEQVHRARRRREHNRRTDDPPQPASPRWAFEQLAAEGRTADEVADALARLRIRPVLTAHPTEATRRTVLSLQARVAELLLAHDDASAVDRRAIERDLTAEVELLWLTAAVRLDRPQVADEIGTVLWYLEDRFFRAAYGVTARIREEFEAVFGAELGDIAPVQPGSWVGGDRDGNPFVTPEVTVEAARRNAHALLGSYIHAVMDLIERLSLSVRIAPTPPALRASMDRDREDLPAVWEANQRRDRDEPLRLKLSFIHARLEATRTWLEDRHAGQSVERVRATYPSVAAFEEDLRLVEAALSHAGADRAIRAYLRPLLHRLRVFGFHGYRLDVREDAAMHEAALSDIGRALGVPLDDAAAIRRELLGRRPLVGPHVPLALQTRRVVDVFRAVDQVQDEIGVDAASTYIISMTHGPADLLRVLLLARDVGLVELCDDPPRSHIDVVPLFETRADLDNAPDTMRALLDDEAYRRQLAARGMRQEIMLGYSDSAKDAGVLPAAWALYRAQESLRDVCADAGVSLTLFHGQGGTVGRGGGSPVYRALSALPPGSVDGHIKITEQGEVISQKFGLLPITRRSLEVLATGTLLATFHDWREHVEPGDVERFSAAMDRMSELALPVFRRYVHEDTRLFELFKTCTPVAELARVHFGSRPAYRDRGAGTMAGIRAIPWVFGWTQIRLMLPGWLGVGTALSTVLAEPGGPELLRRMATAWPFFDDLLGKVEMVCAKADPDIARLYVDALGGDADLLSSLGDEYARTVSALRDIRQSDRLLSDQPQLQTAIALRDPYIDPLSLLQIAHMERRRQAPDAEDPVLDRILGETLNGLAQGLKNTG